MPYSRRELIQAIDVTTPKISEINPTYQDSSIFFLTILRQFALTQEDTQDLSTEDIVQRTINAMPVPARAALLEALRASQEKEKEHLPFVFSAHSGILSFEGKYVRSVISPRKKMLLGYVSAHQDGFSLEEIAPTMYYAEYRNRLTQDNQEEYLDKLTAAMAELHLELSGTPASDLFQITETEEGVVVKPNHPLPLQAKIERSQNVYSLSLFQQEKRIGENAALLLEYLAAQGSEWKTGHEILVAIGSETVEQGEAAERKALAHSLNRLQRVNDLPHTQRSAQFRLIEESVDEVENVRIYRVNSRFYKVIPHIPRPTQIR